MASGSDKPKPKPSWRQRASGEGRASGEQRARSKGVRSWRKPRPGWATKGQKTTSSRPRLIGRLMAFLGVVVFAGVVTWLIGLPGCLTTQILTVANSDYLEYAFPPNPFAMEDEAELRSLDDRDDGRRIFVDPVEDLSDDFEKQIQHQIDKGNPKQVVVVYVNLLGGRNPQGSFVILPHAMPDDLRKATADDPRGFVYLDRLWEMLDPLLSEPKQKVLVILDLTHRPTLWRLGLLENDVYAGAGLEKVVEERPNLFILCSSSPGETSWTSADLGQSVFGHYVAEALRKKDAADRDGKQQVDVNELFQYVKGHTNEWVKQNRDLDGQHPLLFHASSVQEKDLKAFEVAVVTGDKKAGAASESRASCSYDELYKLFLRRDKLNKARQPKNDSDGPHSADAHPGDAIYQLDPLHWRKLNFLLMRAEEWLRARDGRRARETMGKARDVLVALETFESSGPWAQLEKETDRFVRANILSRIKGNDPLPQREAQDSLPLPEQVLERMCRPPYLPSDAGPLLDAKVKKAIDRRKKAEQAASGPLGTYRWVARYVREGDKSRREAEDRLFVASTKAKPGETQPDEAADPFQRAIDTARSIHSAQLLLNRLYAELPELAQWAAERPLAGERSHWDPQESAHRQRLFDVLDEALPDGGKAMPEFEDLQLELSEPQISERKRDDEGDPTFREQKLKLYALENDLLLLFAQARALARQLDRDPDDESDWLHKLDSDTAAARRRLDKVQDDLEAHATWLARYRVDQPQKLHWQLTQSILRYSLLSARTRAKLNARLNDFAAAMADDYDPPDFDSMPSEPNASSSPPGVERGMWRAIWILHVLSLGQPQPELWRDWKKVLNAKGDLESQWELLAQLGDNIRAACANQRKTIRSRVKLSGEETSDLHTELSEARKRFVNADRIARTVHGYDADWLLRQKLDPSAELRRFDLTELLIAHARRYLEDYWFEWYDTAADQCLRAARKAVPESFKVRRLLQKAILEVDKTREPLKEARLSIDASPEAVKLTQQQTHKKLTIRFSKVDKQGVVPDGIVSVWLKKTPFASAADRRGIPTGGGEASLTLQRPAELDDNNCQKNEKVEPMAFFRGRLLGGDRDQKIVVNVNTCPGRVDRVHYTKAPPRGTVVVRGNDNRSLLFILDCSYSMKESLGRGSTSTRFDEARASLQRALDDLAAAFKKNPDYRVGLMAYGHRVQLLKGQEKPVPNGKWPEQIPADVLKNAFKDIQLLAGIEKFNDSQQAGIKGWLETLNWWGNTPLLGAISQGIHEFRKLNTNGTIVAITDGAYSDWYMKATLRAQLQALQKKEVPFDLHVVWFGPDGRNEVDGEGERVWDVLTQLAEREPVDARDRRELEKRLKQAITPRHYTVTGIPPSDFEETQGLGEPVSDLVQGSYRLGFAERQFDFPIAGGEELSFKLVGNKLVFESEIATGRPPSSPRDLRSTDPDTVVDRDCRIISGGRAQFVVSLVRKDVKHVVRRPEEIHFEIAGVSQTGENGKNELMRSSNWKVESGHSVPTWSMIVPDWPKGARADVKAYWKMQRSTPDVRISWKAASDAGGEEFLLGGENRVQFTASALHQADSGLAEVTIKIKGAHNEPLAASALDELANLRVELGRKGLDNPYTYRDLSFTRVFYHDEGELRVEFTVGATFQRDTALIGITSLRRWKANAAHGELNGLTLDNTF